MYRSADAEQNPECGLQQRGSGDYSEREEARVGRLGREKRRKCTQRHVSLVANNSSFAGGCRRLCRRSSLTASAP